MWKVLSASIGGTSHRRNGTDCQDFCASGEYEIAGIPCLIVAISDGAGSATHSRLGAELAVLNIIRAISATPKPPSEFDQTDAVLWIEKVQDVLRQCAVEKGYDFKDLACTILAACICDEYACFLQIGDGAWIVSVESNLKAATWPKSGEYANETIFVTSSNSKESLTFVAIRARVEAIAGLTDGLQLLSLNFADKTPHFDFFYPIIDRLKATSNPADLSQPFCDFLDSDLVNDRTDDDKTLFVAVRNQEVNADDLSI